MSEQPSPPDDLTSVTMAVMLGRIEAQLGQILAIMVDHNRMFDEVWLRLRAVELARERSEQWQDHQDKREAKRPNWTTIASVIIALVSLAFSAGIILTKGL